MNWGEKIVAIDGKRRALPLIWDDEKSRGDFTQANSI